jgi:hypothetical protein
MDVPQRLDQAMRTDGRMVCGLSARAIFRRQLPNMAKVGRDDTVFLPSSNG